MKSPTAYGPRQSNDHEVPVADKPAPGHFYDIRPGDGGLLKTAGRAYSLEEGAKRLRAAQALNNHPLNRKFWRSPKNDFERKHFPAGIIGFKPEYACGDTQARVDRSAKRCFARIWVPPLKAAYHSQLGHGISLPASALPSFVPTSLSTAAVPVRDVRKLFAPHICEILDAGCSTGLQPDEVCNIGADSRTKVEDTTLAPYRWTCHLHLFFREHPLSEVIWRFAGATGFLVGNDHVLTSAHAIHDHIFGPFKPAVTALAAVVIPGRDGILEDLLNLSTYGAFLVNDRNAFKVPPEWKGCKRERGKCADEVQFDYALISLTKASQCDTIRPRLGTRPAGFWGADKTGTHIATQVRGFRLSTVSNLEVVAAGYPGDKPCTQWSSRGRMRGIRYRGTAAHNVLEHELFAARGLSGAPVWGRVRIKGRGQLVLVGIHSSCQKEERTGRAIAGEATLITREVWRRIKAWMAT